MPAASAPSTFACRGGRAHGGGLRLGSRTGGCAAAGQRLDTPTVDPLRRCTSLSMHTASCRMLHQPHLPVIHKQQAVGRQPQVGHHRRKALGGGLAQARQWRLAGHKGPVQVARQPQLVLYEPPPGQENKLRRLGCVVSASQQQQQQQRCRPAAVRLPPSCYRRCGRRRSTSTSSTSRACPAHVPAAPGGVV